MWRRFIQMIQYGKPVLSTDHMARTANSFRQEGRSKATVERVAILSPTVKELKLRCEPKVDFKAGQWVDVFIPHTELVGGFSICSPPYEMEKDGSMCLAVKFVPATPAEWCHQCSLKDTFEFRVGGDFFFEPDVDTETRNLILIAGGVGVNPLRSIIAQTLYVDDRNFITRRIFLLYSAKTELELLFKEDFILFNSQFNNFTPKFFVTNQADDWSQSVYVQRRRIEEKDIKAVIDQSNGSSKVFICGPPPLLEYTLNNLNRLRYPKENIVYENWW